MILLKPISVPLQSRLGALHFKLKSAVFKILKSLQDNAFGDFNRISYPLTLFNIFSQNWQSRKRIQDW